MADTLFDQPWLRAPNQVNKIDPDLLNPLYISLGYASVQIVIIIFGL